MTNILVSVPCKSIYIENHYRGGSCSKELVGLSKPTLSLSLSGVGITELVGLHTYYLTLNSPIGHRNLHQWPITLNFSIEILFENYSFG